MTLTARMAATEPTPSHAREAPIPPVAQQGTRADPDELVANDPDELVAAPAQMCLPGTVLPSTHDGCRRLPGTGA